MIFKYDREADILYINKRAPYPEQESEEVGDDVIARFNPDTGDVENIEVLFLASFAWPIKETSWIKVP
jgi:uncharacterized protein YuzE